MRDPLRADDPRLTHYVDALPHYRAWLEHAIRAERSGVPPTPAAGLTLGAASIYLGIKLCEANRQALAVETEARTLPRKANALREYLLAWARLSTTLDAFVFSAYGALDALAQAIVLAQDIATAEEIKFPTLEHLLAPASLPPDGAPAVRAVVLDTLAAPWFRDLRRLRNLINYRSVLPAAVGGALPLAQPRAPWPAPPLPGLDRLDALPGYARDTLAHVAATVETAITALER